jgi:hypothetical protein
MQFKVPLKDFRERLKLSGTPVNLVEYKRGEDDVEQQLAEMNRENKEKSCSSIS